MPHLEDQGRPAALPGAQGGGAGQGLSGRRPRYGGYEAWVRGVRDQLKRGGVGGFLTSLHAAPDSPPGYEKLAVWKFWGQEKPCYVRKRNIYGTERTTSARSAD